MTYLLALDQGTSSSRSIVFDERGHIVAQAQLELPQIYPQPGWVEHDPEAIWGSVLGALREALDRAGCAPGDIAGPTGTLGLRGGQQGEGNPDTRGATTRSGVQPRFFHWSIRPLRCLGVQRLASMSSAWRICLISRS